MDLNDFKAKRFYHTPKGIAKGIRLSLIHI